MIAASFWPFDPKGYLKHLMVGALLVILFAPLRRDLLTLVSIIAVAVGKEVYDGLIRLVEWDIMDIFYTVLPFFIIKIHNKMKNLFPLLLLLTLAFSCQEPDFDAWQVIRIKEDNHRSSPWHYDWNKVSYRAYKWELKHSCLYSHGDSDQCDWNKLTGASHRLLTNHTSSLMTAWRQPVDTIEIFQLGAYYHDGNYVYHPPGTCSDPTHITYDDLPVINAEPNQEFETHERINEDHDYHSFYVENMETGEFYDFGHEFGEFTRTREIGPWFGGTKPAPHDMLMIRLLIAEEK